MKSRQIGQKRQSEDSEFSRMLDASLEKTQAIEPGRVVLVSIKNIAARDFVPVEFEGGMGVIERSELLDTQGRVRFSSGEKLKAFYQSLSGGEHHFTLLPAGRNKRSMLEAAMQNRMPLYGKISSQPKGGYEVEIGEIVAFCPGSQMQKEGAAVGAFTNVLVTEVGERKIIVSERAYMDDVRAKRKAELAETLRPGDIVTGKIASIQSFGLFVDLGGFEGLVPRSEISYLEANPREYRPGDEVRARVLSVDWKEYKLSLSIRALLDNPWQGQLPFSQGDILEGKVDRIKPFGVFVKLPGNFTGLVPASESGLPRGAVLEKEFQKNAVVRVMVMDIHREKEKIGLSIRRVQDFDTRQEYEAYMAENRLPESEKISSFGKQLLASLKKDE